MSINIRSISLTRLREEKDALYYDDWNLKNHFLHLNLKKTEYFLLGKNGLLENRQ